MQILSLGGSLIKPDKLDVHFLKRFRDLILSVREKTVVVCGGGAVAREYIAAAKAFRAGSVAQDAVGIQSTVLNATLVRQLFGEAAYPRVLQEPRRLAFRHRVLVGAGWKPGSSSDFEAVLWAEKLGVNRVINLTNVDYVYSRDPHKYADANLLKLISWPEFLSLVGVWRAGGHMPFDPVAAKLAMRCGIEVVIVNGKKLANVRRAIEGGSFVGTVIS